MQQLQLHKIVLRDFWNNYGTVRGHKYRSKRSKQQVIDELIRIGTIRLFYNSTHDRQHFDKLKVKRKKFMNFLECFACGGKAQARHHVIWLKNGGRNQRNNVIGICNDCHAEVHTWLKR